MLALITGASSGMGREMAKYLAGKGWNLILTARRVDRLEKLRAELPSVINVEIISVDLSVTDNVKKLYYLVSSKYDIDMLVNNAGFGVFGEFIQTDLDKDLQLINTNIIAVHILTKLFLKDFVKQNRGIILNVASSAGFLAGPLLGPYYASKNYVVRLTEAVYEELRRRKSNVKISCFCPGPVRTEFNDVAGVSFSINGIDGAYAAQYALDNTFKGKLIIIPTFAMKSARLFMRLLPEKTLTKMCYNVQKKKGKEW